VTLLDAMSDPSADEPIRHLTGHAALRPDQLAARVEPDGTSRTYGELEARSIQLANLLVARGLGLGDHLAILLPNRVEFFEAVWAAMRIGLYVTPINWHLAPDEAAYIVADCEAAAIVADPELGPALDAVMASADPPAVRLLVRGPDDGSLDGSRPAFEDYEAALAEQPTTPPADECEGTWMLYSSGTTGRPKGIKPPRVGAPLGTSNPFTSLLTGMYGFDEHAVYLSPAPLYHAAPAGDR
jgi:acyl-CoA synthetase (AMP-forming)/AMP-acid ligase II